MSGQRTGLFRASPLGYPGRAGQRDGHGRPEHGNTTASRVSSAGEARGPAAVTLCIFTALFCHSRSRRGGCRLAHSQGRLHRSESERHTLGSTIQPEQPRTPSPFPHTNKGPFICLTALFIFSCVPFYCSLTKSMDTAISHPHGTQMTFKPLCSLVIFGSFHTPIETKLRQTLKTKDLSRHV